MNSNKACGLDGITPGIFKLLPSTWLLLLATLFNNLFIPAWYPMSWSKAKLFTIFKKGNRLCPGNYRGISVISSIAKLYDMILCSRLKTWFKPYREQAGSQEKRSCTEHIVCLRLLCDMARRKKLKLFVLFVDFSKAYDMVPRQMLFRVLVQTLFMVMFQSKKSVSKPFPTNASRVAKSPYQFGTLFAFTKGEYISLFFTLFLYTVGALQYFYHDICTLSFILISFNYHSSK